MNLSGAHWNLPEKVGEGGGSVEGSRQAPDWSDQRSG